VFLIDTFLNIGADFLLRRSLVGISFVIDACFCVKVDFLLSKCLRFMFVIDTCLNIGADFLLSRSLGFVFVIDTWLGIGADFLFSRSLVGISFVIDACFCVKVDLLLS